MGLNMETILQYPFAKISKYPAFCFLVMIFFFFFTVWETEITTFPLETNFSLMELLITFQFLL